MCSVTDGMGARSCLSILKTARTLWGESVEPFEAMLVKDPLGMQSWALRPVATVDDERVVALWEQVLTANDICREKLDALSSRTQSILVCVAYANNVSLSILPAARCFQGFHRFRCYRTGTLDHLLSTPAALAV